MKPVECIAEEALGEILGLPDTDPRRRHAATCPRCAALLVSYQRFMAAETDDSSPGLGREEERRLAAFRAELLGGEPVAGAPIAGAGAERGRGAGRAAPAWWSAWFRPAARPAWALAFAAIVAVALWLRPQPVPRDLQSEVRGGAESELALTLPEVRSDGSVWLAWRAHPGADRYEVRVYSTAFEEIRRFDAGPDSSVTLAPDAMREAYRDGEWVMYRVVALHGGDEVAQSTTGSIRRP